MNENNGFVTLFYGLGFCVVIVCVIAMGVIYTTSQTETKIGKVCDVNNNRVILCDGEVILAKNINQFDWQIGKGYNITVESHLDILGDKRTYIIENTKHEIGDENDIK